jgi:hypothetical protein
MTETCRHKAQTIKAHTYHSKFVGFTNTNGVLPTAQYGTCQNNFPYLWTTEVLPTLCTAQILIFLCYLLHAWHSSVEFLILSTMLQSLCSNTVITVTTYLCLCPEPEVPLLYLNAPQIICKWYSFCENIILDLVINILCYKILQTRDGC